MSHFTTHKVWKTLRFNGEFKTTEDFQSVIQNAGMDTTGWEDRVINDPTFATGSLESEVDLVNLSLGELGFSEEVSLEEVNRRAQKLGLRLCPSWVGLILRLQYNDQPQKESLFIGMLPVDKLIFRLVGEVDIHWLSVCTLEKRVQPADIFRFVFVKPRG